MPPTLITLKGRRVNINTITTKARPYIFSKKFHTLDRQLLINDISSHNRNISGLGRMPKSKSTDEEIKRLKNLVREKTKEISQRKANEVLHNVRFGN